MEFNELFVLIDGASPVAAMQLIKLEGVGQGGFLKDLCPMLQSVLQEGLTIDKCYWSAGFYAELCRTMCACVLSSFSAGQALVIL